jgi:DNA polymerase III alpha subunit
LDIDIDLKTTFDPIKTIPGATRASMVRNGKLVSHQCGVYFSNIPKDPITGVAAIPYEDAEAIGYLKIDFLHLHLLDHFESREEIKTLLTMDPNWELLRSPKVVASIFQLGKQWEVVDAVRPRSVSELADTLALTKPAKRFLLELYHRDRAAARRELYKKDDDSYAYKKAHAYAYALNIVLQLHLIELGALDPYKDK